MGKCNKEFLDFDGKRSKHYYDYVDKFGHEAALSNYVDHMMSSDKKLSDGAKLSPVELVEKLIKDKVPGSVSPTAALNKEIKTEAYDETKINKAITRSAVTKEVRARLVEANEATIQQEVSKKLSQLVPDPTNKHKKIPYEQAYMDALKRSSKINEQAGTDIHEIVSIGTTLLVDYINSHKNDTTSDLFIKSKDNLFRINRNKEYNEFIKDFSREVRGIHMDNTTFSSVSNGLYSILKNTVDLLNNLASKWGVSVTDLKLYSEKTFSSADPELKIHGIPDLVIVDKTTGRSWIADYKTKNTGAYDNIIKEYSGSYTKQFRDLSVNPLNDAAIQMSYYGALLQSVGLDVQGGSVIAIDIIKIPTYDTVGKDFPNQKLEYKLYNNRIKTIDVSLYINRVEDFAKGKDFSEKHISDAEGSFKPIKSYGASHPEDLSKLEAVLDHKDKYIEQKLNNIVYNKSTGEVSFETLSSNKEYVILKTVKESEFDLEAYKKELETQYEDIMHKKVIIPSRVVSWFNAGKTDAFKTFGARGAEVLNSLFSDIDVSQYTLHQAKDINKKAFGDLGNDLLIAISKDGSDVRFYSILSAVNKKLSFDTSKDPKHSSRTSIFGKFITDNDARFHMSVNSPYNAEATMHDIYALKLTTAALLYRDSINSSAVIGPLKVVSLIGNKSDMSYHTVEGGVATLRTFRQLDIDFPSWLGKILDKLPADISKEFTYDSMSALAEILLSGDYDGTNIMPRNDTAELLQMLKVYTPAMNLALEDKLGKFYTKLYNANSLLYKHTKVLDKKLEVIRGALLGLANINMHTKQVMITGSFSDLFPLRSLTDAPDYYVKQWEVLREKYMNLGRKRISQFFTEHNKLIKDITGGAPTFSKEQYRRFFKDPDFSGEPINWMMMDNPNTPSKKFSPEEKAYIKFFNKHIKESLYSLTKDKAAKEAIKADNVEGIIPILTSRTKLDTSSSQAMFASIVRRLTPISKEYGDVDAEFKADRALEFKSKFSDEVSGGGLQYSERRKRALGIETGHELNKHEIEQNLPIILHTLKYTAIEGELFGSLTRTTNVLLDELYSKELKHNWKTSKTVDFLLKMWSMSVQNQYKEDKNVGRILDKTRRVISTSLFGANIQQMSTETFTAIVRGTTTAFQQELVRVMGGRQRFSLKSLLFSQKALFNLSRNEDNYIYRVALDNGIIFTDLREMRGNNFTRYNKAQQIQRDLIAGGNTIAHNQFRYSIFTAIAKEDGVVDAYKYDVNGDKQYNEAADKRHYVYDPKLNIPGAKKEPPKEGTEDYDKWLIWKGRREALLKEGLVDPKTGRMQAGYTAAERTQMLEYITHMFGSMRDDAKIYWDYGSLARQLTLYKRWATVKITNIFTKTHNSYYNSVWKINETESKAVFEESPREGIYQTFKYLLQHIYEMKSIKGGFKDLDVGQRENIAAAISNVTTATFLTLIGTAFMAANKDKIQEDPMKLALWKGAINAYSELNTVQLLLSMNNEVFPTLSILVGTLHRIIKATNAATFEGDPSQALTDLTGLSSFIGSLKTVKGIGFQVAPETFKITKKPSTIPITSMNITVNPTRPTGF